jgi:hypothetical protein
MFGMPDSASSCQAGSGFWIKERDAWIMGFDLEQAEWLSEHDDQVTLGTASAKDDHRLRNT